MRACATNDKQMIKSAKTHHPFIEGKLCRWHTHSVVAHVLNMRFYIHRVAGYQCDRQIVELGGEKQELRGEGAVASASASPLPGPPPQCEALPHSHCSRINLLVSVSSGKPAGLFTSPVLALRCLILFFFFPSPQQIEHQEAISYQSVWF